MHLPQTAEYALRAMACIALKDDEKPVPSKVLAKSTDIPSHYLSKIMRKMVEAGLVSSKKGHGGGFKLAKAPEKITFEQILEAADYKIEPESCVFGWGKCDSDKPCPLHNSWSQLKDSFQWWSENKTLQDVIDHPGDPDPLLEPANI